MLILIAWFWLVHTMGVDYQVPYGHLDMVLLLVRIRRNSPSLRVVLFGSLHSVAKT